MNKGVAWRLGCLTLAAFVVMVAVCVAFLWGVVAAPWQWRDRVFLVEEAARQALAPPLLFIGVLIVGSYVALYREIVRRATPPK